ncbi:MULTISPECIES: phosphotransferase family protein [Amycolatopsis]|uniref:phosphotransferase family protein n=1 Tax=Amycolatopsis TaxID=1813 RepID=UPI001E5E07F6|nr:MULTISPECIES: phosphotransferase [Amycolatopsis]
MALLAQDGGRIFCKGIAEAGGRRGVMHRHEAEVNRWLPSAIAPRLRWSVEVEDWLLLGFEHVPGRHADLAPGAPDLAKIVPVLGILGAELAACPVQAPLVAEQWARLASWRRLAKDTPPDLDPWAREHLDELVAEEARAIELVAGDHLVHTDLHSLNIFVGEDGARIVDWAWSRRGNPALDTAFLIPRLIAAGHHPDAAECWPEAVLAWRSTPAATRKAFAIAIWGIWQLLERDQSLPHRPALITAARGWTLHRIHQHKIGNEQADQG